MLLGSVTAGLMSFSGGKKAVSPQNIVPSASQPDQVSEESTETYVPGLMHPTLLHLEFQRNEVMANAKYRGKRLNCSVFGSAKVKEDSNGDVYAELAVDRYGQHRIIYLIDKKHKKLIAEKGLPSSLECLCVKFKNNVLILGDCKPEDMMSCRGRCKVEYAGDSLSRCLELCERNHGGDK